MGGGVATQGNPPLVVNKCLMLALNVRAFNRWSGPPAGSLWGSTPTMPSSIKAHVDPRRDRPEPARVDQADRDRLRARLRPARVLLLRRSIRPGRPGMPRSSRAPRPTRAGAATPRPWWRPSCAGAARLPRRSPRPSALAIPDAVAVVTGQQAGLFGGPVFTLLKAITTIQTAAQVAAEQQVPVTAVFWVDAEDHDWAEVASCSVLDTDLERRTVTLSPPAGAGEGPVAGVRLDGSVGAAIDELAAMLGATEFSATLLTRLRAAYRSGAGMAEAFARWLDMLLGEHGLVVYDASDPSAKPLVREIFARELTDAGRVVGAGGRGGPRAGLARVPCAGRTAPRQRGALPPVWRPPPDARQRRPDQHGIGEPVRRRLGRRGAGQARVVQPERAPAPGRAGRPLPHRLLRLGSERAGLPGTARRRLRPFRRAAAAAGTARYRPR